MNFFQKLFMTVDFFDSEIMLKFAQSAYQINQYNHVILQDIEPYYNWRHLYAAEEDKLSPFYGRTYSEFEFSQHHL